MEAICTCGKKTFVSVNYKGIPKCPECRELKRIDEQQRIIRSKAQKNAKANRYVITLGARLI